MCGIFGYIGKGKKTAELIEGLARLEYRGYDSCGIAALKAGEVFFKKRAGKIAFLKSELSGWLEEKFNSAILHTRWATHGKPTQTNAHPHFDCRQEFILAHNGIIENYHKIKQQLIKEGHNFLSETDTEVIVHLFEKLYDGSLKDVALKVVAQLEGSFALAVMYKHNPAQLVLIRKGSPLIVGLGKDENFFASDMPALLPLTKKVAYLDDEQVAILEQQKADFFDFKGKKIKPKIETVNLKAEDAEKKGFSHFMLKEINEQPDIIKKAFSLYSKNGKINFSELKFSEAYIKNLRKIFITACGTAYHAGYVAKYFLEKYCAVDVEIDTSSEFRYHKINIKKDDLLIAISQSGETADTLAAAREFKKAGGKILSICNVLGSSLVKESYGLIPTLAGPEIGVASTKAYTAQLFCLFLFGLYTAGIKKTLNGFIIKNMLGELAKIAAYQQEIIDKHKKIENIAGKFSKLGSFLFLGRGINFPLALEGALKLKEISYIPAEGYPAGEMKHGPIALIDEYRAVICIVPQDFLYEKMVSNMQEAKARKGKILAILNYEDQEAKALADEVIYTPKLKYQDFSPLVSAVALQLFAYYVAKRLGCEIDQPRNLAKSVTVE